MIIKLGSQSARNRTLYEGSGIVDEYSSPEQELHRNEEAIFDQISDQLIGASILDIGVGGGRTTNYLLGLTDQYIGIDYSRSMVEACRNRFPATDIRHFDARHLNTLCLRDIDFVLFSFNGIDCVNHEDRVSIYKQIHHVLKPGGLFMFSTHNLRRGTERPWSPGQYQWNLNSWPVSLFKLVRHSLNFVRNFRLEIVGDGYAVLRDMDIDYRAVYYFIDPAEQVRQLEDNGFQEIQLFDQAGNLRPPSHSNFEHTFHMHVLARKAAKSC
jgi:SAM-dependent methyltransferase